MDPHYPYVPAYAPSQPPDNRQSFHQSPTSQSLGPNPTAFPATLPPISGSYLPFSTDHSAQGASPSYVAYAPATTIANGQPSSHSGYPRQTFLQPSHVQQTPRSLPPAQHYQQAWADSSSGYRPYGSSNLQQGRLADIRPMPYNSFHEGPTASTTPGPSIQTPLSQLPTRINSEPTHVVGSQGRRGILPSANGRPVAVPNTNSSKSSTAGLKKDPEDGKWPCEYCSKRYLHAKHLKRHLLRHTGTRPYTCGLCKDNFSRSDILKRHFIKCSIRRGNPSGENHLTHSRANKKLRGEPGEGNIRQLHTSSLPNQLSDTIDFGLSGFHNASDLTGVENGQASFSESRQSRSNQLSRTNSVKDLSKSTPVSVRGNYTAPNSAGFDSSGFSYSGGQATPDSLTTSGAATPFNYQGDARSNQLSPSTNIDQHMYGLDLNSISRGLAGPSYPAGSLPHIVEQSHDRSNDMDWSLNHNEDEYTGGQYPHSGHIQQPIKTEVNHPNGHFSLAHNYPFHASSRWKH